MVPQHLARAHGGYQCGHAICSLCCGLVLRQCGGVGYGGGVAVNVPIGLGIGNIGGGQVDNIVGNTQVTGNEQAHLGYVARIIGSGCSGGW